MYKFHFWSLAMSHVWAVQAVIYCQGSATLVYIILKVSEAGEDVVWHKGGSKGGYVEHDEDGDHTVSQNIEVTLTLNAARPCT